MALFVAVPGHLYADDVPSEVEAKWNDSDLLAWVSGIGGEASRYDDLATVQSFEMLQRTIDEVKQMVLHDATTEREDIEGLRMILKHLASETGDTPNNDFRNPLFARRDPRNLDVATGI